MDPVTALAAWAADDPWGRSGAPTREALRRAMANLLAVAAGGAAAESSRRLRAAWATVPGPATVFGETRGGSVESAAWLNSVAAVYQERDEGNRHAKGHPGAQTVFAVLALAEERGVDGDRLWAGLLAGYEIAARVGRATAFAPGVHTHGPLGAVGAAAGCAVVLGLDAAGIAAAIDAGAAMAPATSWRAVDGGSAVRDQWVGQGAVAGLAAARYAAAGAEGRAHGLDGSLAGGLGVIDASDLLSGLGTHHLVDSSYLKRHSSCAYTHGAADAALIARERMTDVGRSFGDIDAVLVEGVASAAALDSTEWTTRMGAYFSVPFVVASALVHGDVAAHRATGAEHEIRDLAPKIRVVDATEALAPATATSRPARVTVRLRDGSEFRGAVRHPAGDSIDSPFSAEMQHHLLREAAASAGLDGSDIERAVRALATGPVRDALRPLISQFEGVHA
ncbi:MmgE/PrpD family protein [Microbacterium excoecariae]|uniref:MmgE/PrpD family protein n=1 Tax=Microbacterium excoecariae TaxID=2715210 RepID=UPI00140A48B4|nr:MmgE/PrpD family protein [Microbacterium excoecariae]NHI17675.1 MmgE/PrpD family protein [Microbacterium excoecariae]